MSGVVLPASMPVADHGEMRSRDELVNRLLDIMEMQARALNHEAPKSKPEPRRPGHRPNEKDMREYSAFRARYQKLERDVRRDLQLAPDAELSKETLSANGGEPPKSMTSHMLWHGLGPEQWPPSTWPKEPPEPA